MNFFKRKIKDEDYTPRVINDIPSFIIKESYKTIRANINFALPVPRCKKIMICSSFTSEGKTTTCVNLAITVAETGKKVLIIDCDLRRSKVHKFFNMENEIGLSHFLSNDAELDDIIQETNIVNLDFISAGGTHPNPAELLTKRKMGKLIDALAEVFDYIFIDTPPICVVSDALPLAKICDGVVLVVKHKRTTHSEIKESLEKLEFAQANVIGMILNGIQIEQNYKMYGKYGKYSKYSKYSGYNNSVEETKSNDDTAEGESEVSGENNSEDNSEEYPREK